jgi:hypothetical protein
MRYLGFSDTTVAATLTWAGLALLILMIAATLTNVAHHVPHRSRKDDRVYHILAKSSARDRKEAATRLGVLVRSTGRFVRHLHRRAHGRPGDEADLRYRSRRRMISRLASRYPPRRIAEGTGDCHFVRNKGQELVICVRGPEGCGFMSLRALRDVMIHELAHVASESTGHGREFQDNFAFLRQESDLFFRRKMGGRGRGEA